MNVHILVTCRNPELIRASTLVFDSIRVGFPDAKVTSHVNGLSYSQYRDAFYGPLQSVGNIESVKTVHHDWIEKLIQGETEPFFICDTDVIFWKRFPVEDFKGHHLAGRFIPRHHCEFMRCATLERLHTSLMYIDPVEIRKRIEKYHSEFPETPFGNTRPNLIEGRIFPFPGKFDHSVNYFHDTCSQLYHAVGGTAFTEAHLDCYDHLNCGTYSDLISNDAKSIRMMRRNNDRLMKNPELARGLWREQDNYYAQHFIP